MSEGKDSQHVSVIGLGNMGGALAEALLNNGHRVTVWNRTSSKCAPLAHLGAEVAGTSTDAVKSADTVVICVVDDEVDPKKKRLTGATLLEIVDKNEEVVFYGGTTEEVGLSVPAACAKAVTWGFTQVYYFAGGLPAWKKAGYPVETGQ